MPQKKQRRGPPEPTVKVSGTPTPAVRGDYVRIVRLVDTFTFEFQQLDTIAIVDELRTGADGSVGLTFMRGPRVTCDLPGFARIVGEIDGFRRSLPQDLQEAIVEILNGARGTGAGDAEAS